MSMSELRGRRVRAYRPPAPLPRERPLGTIGLLLTMWQNPLATWTRAHFEQPFVTGKSVLGKIAVVSDAAAIRHILVDNSTNYHKGPLQRRMLSPGLGSGLLTAEDEDWRAQRRALAPLFTPRVVEAFAPAMGEAARSLLQRWQRQRPGRTLDIAGEMSRITLDVLERTIFPEGLGRAPGEFARAITLYSETLGRIDPLDILGFPDWVPRLTRRSAQPALDFFVQVVNGMIVARDPSQVPRPGEDSRGPDLLTLLVKASDPVTGKGLSEAEVRANIVTFIAAGHETTANTLTWALFLLATHPQWRQAAEAEVDAALPDGATEGPPVSAALLKALPLIRAIIDESLRLYPPAASLTREALKSDIAAGIRINKGTIVIVSPWVIHRHQLLWDDPDSFNPARFLPDARNTIDRFSYLPFGAGPRVCIGASFALQESVVVLASIIREFRLELAPDAVIVPVQRLTLRPKFGMPMIIRRRK